MTDAFDIAVTHQRKNVISAVAADATKHKGKAMSGKDKQG